MVVGVAKSVVVVEIMLLKLVPLGIMVAWMFRSSASIMGGSDEVGG